MKVRRCMEQVFEELLALNLGFGPASTAVSLERQGRAKIARGVNPVGDMAIWRLNRVSAWARATRREGDEV